MVNLQSFIQQLKNMLASTQVPFMKIPPVILSLSSPLRPGLSAKKITSEIIENQHKAGAPSGPLPDGSQNIAEAMEMVRVDAIMKALREDVKIQVALPPGCIEVVSYGSNSGGPVISRGTNITPASVDGIIT